MNKNFYKRGQGFTLIELLIIIAVIAILATIVFVALNPLARFQDSRNARRWSDVESIASAIKLYQVDNSGTNLSDVEDMTESIAYQIGGGSNCALDCTFPAVTTDANCVDIGSLTKRGYIPAIPFDPNAAGASTDNTHYYIIKNPGGSLTIGACNEEQGSASVTPSISVSR